MIDEVKVIGQISDAGLQINTTITQVGPQGPQGLPGDASVIDYSVILNKPQIELVELVGNKTFEELGITAMGMADIDNLL